MQLNNGITNAYIQFVGIANPDELSKSPLESMAFLADVKHQIAALV